ncbi:hypothetical protein [Streptomonospora salina]|uniref:Uncharacterized protein n=1 Tax=Streptomonospora salina TaxID=104205 RepID=A0A841EIA8_9ACTN|nr:hypothetical protein [Streptomonospora salina]MBB6000100.1 hypothetical protein [Streptomonospora salina]
MLIGVCSLGGSPGVSTLALAMAAAWPEDQDRPLLVEADASGGDVAAWRGRGSEVGLLSLAAQARNPRADGDAVVWEHTQPLQGGVPAVLAPAAPHRAEPCLWQLTQAVEVLRAPGTALLLDLGRMAPRSYGAWLAGRTDALVVLASAEVAQIRRVCDCAEVLAALPERGTRVGLALAGAGMGGAEVAEQTGLQVWGRIPRDAVAADYIAGQREARPARMGRRPLLRGAAALGERARGEHRTRQQRMRELIAAGQDRASGGDT